MQKMTFVRPDGKQLTVDAPEGRSVMRIAQENGIDIEGACEGMMACGTCHVIVEPGWASKLPVSSEEERDMLDLMTDLTRTSRLACQIMMMPELDGLVVGLPVEVRNILLD